MGRPKTSDRQLAIDGTEAMRWEELPPAIREHAREQLAILLRRAAGRREGVPPEVGDAE